MLTRTEYLLTLLSEESAEIIQRATKAQRFGLSEVQPGQDESNHLRLRNEVLDLFVVIEMLRAEGVELYNNRSNADIAYMKRKRETVEAFMRYSRECGCLA